MKKSTLTRIIAVSLAIPIGIALSACTSSSSTDEESDTTILEKYTDNWVATQISFGNFMMRMPPYIVDIDDYVSKYVCNYKGQDYTLYLFTLDKYAYTGGKNIANSSDLGYGKEESEIEYEDEDVSVTECGDALDRSEWLIERYYAKSNKLDEQDVMITFNNIQDDSDKDRGYARYKLSATMDIVYSGYWVCQKDTESYLLLSDNQEMLDLLISTLSKES